MDRWIAVIGLCVVLVWILLHPPHANASMIPEANKYRKTLQAEGRRIWGYDAPLPLFAAQIHQESAWREGARSKYAIGLTQFTPATAAHMNSVYGSELSDLTTYSPLWAIRAMVLYNRHIYIRLKPYRAQEELEQCQRFAMMLSAYNGGPGWVSRDRRLAESSCFNPDIWFEHVELFSNRADWAIRENRDYVRKIIFRHQPLYMQWGAVWVCSEEV